MTGHVPLRGLFETHLSVSNIRRSIAFYRDIVGLHLALEVYERGAAFFWIGDRSCYSSRRSMLGLWSIGNAPIGLTLHVAFEVAGINELLDAPKRLKEQGLCHYHSLEWSRWSLVLSDGCQQPPFTSEILMAI